MLVPCHYYILRHHPLSPLVPASTRPPDARVPPPPSPGEWDRDGSVPVSASDNKSSEAASGAYPRCWHSKWPRGDCCHRVIDAITSIIGQDSEDLMSVMVVSLCFSPYTRRSYSIIISYKLLEEFGEE
jgi:hypothetical protein